VYDEFLLMQLALAMRRSQRERGSAAPVLRCTKAIDQRIRKRFPFTLTPDQDTVIAEITSDLARATPANRLIQGDVGSGKTAVAVYALLLAVASGHQGALMAPTEILAEQHHASIAQLLTGAAVSPTLLTGRLTPKARASVLAGLADGSVPLVVGTHALLTERVAFKSLAVAIIDEQHRFGVHQRAALRTRGVGAPSEGGLVHVPHTLVMTATPIPRTLAMTVMGDLDVSSIAHLPPGRKPVATRLVDASRVGEVWDFVRKRVERGEQVFVVAPTIDGSTDDAPLTDAPGDAAAVTTASAPTGVLQIAESLREGPLKGLSIGVVHGRLAPEDRERVMNAFRAAEISVLVATTVIEVGVDVPNATIMVILQADRFGLAQLHQLRGRVGRGERPSACVAVPSAGVDTTARLAAFVTTPDGFELAERDLEIRGFGSMIGAEQSGLPPFKIADLSRDRALLELARRDAGAWIERSPALGAPEEALVRRRLMKLHGPWLGLADVG
jgi:ATP-dependent DNA helicase RecG